MNELTVKHVDFFGDDLLATKDADGNIWAGAKWICNGIGLSRGQSNGEIAKIQADEVLRQGCMKFRAGVFDPNNPTIALKLDFVPLWLAKISITPTMKQEAPEVASKLERYQLQAKEVLAAAFLPASVSKIGELSPELQMFKQIFDCAARIELEQKQQAQALEETNAKLDGIRDVVSLNTQSWREDARRLIVRIAQKMGGNEYIREVQTEISKLVDERAGVSLETRLTNKRRRMAEEGACKSKRDKLSKVDVIADDKKLIEIYVAIVKEMSIKYGICEKVS